jgi:hypothetical protein
LKGPGSFMLGFMLGLGFGGGHVGVSGEGSLIVNEEGSGEDEGGGLIGL